jgi:hypothetical protein
VRAVFQLILLGALATPTGAQSTEIFGYAGVLGEWELTASVTAKPSTRAKEFSGPLTMKHVGILGWSGRKKRRNPFSDIGIRDSNARDTID